MKWTTPNSKLWTDRGPHVIRSTRYNHHRPEPVQKPGMRRHLELQSRPHSRIDWDIYRYLMSYCRLYRAMQRRSVSMGAGDKITDWSIVGIGSADGLHPPIRNKTCLMSALTCGLMEVKHIKEISNWRYDLWVCSEGLAFPCSTRTNLLFKQIMSGFLSERDLLLYLVQH